MKTSNDIFLLENPCSINMCVVLCVDWLIISVVCEWGRWVAALPGRRPWVKPSARKRRSSRMSAAIVTALQCDHCGTAALRTLTGTDRPSKHHGTKPQVCLPPPASLANTCFDMSASCDGSSRISSTSCFHCKTPWQTLVKSFTIFDFWFYF